MAISFNKKIRRNQLIFTFGIGQMIDFPDKSSLMLGGVNAWDALFSFLDSSPGANFNIDEFKIRDQRLERKLNVKHFLRPPEFRRANTWERENIPNQNIQLPYVRFPLWHYCTTCNYMEKLPLHFEKTPYCRKKCGEKKFKNILIPVRFVCICDNGHIEDFPFESWIEHKDVCKGNEDKHLKFIENERTSNIGAIKIACEKCKSSRSLNGIFNANIFEKKHKCNGKRPWLGGMNDDLSCNEGLKVTLRNSNSVFYPILKKSLFIKYDDTEIDYFIDKVINSTLADSLVRTFGFTEGDIDNKVIDMLISHYPGIINRENEVKAALKQKYNHEQGLATLPSDDDTNEETFRYEEYDSIINLKENRELVLNKHEISEYQDLIKFCFKDIILIEKLRETIAFCGFKRKTPPEDVILSNFTKQLTTASNGPQWLPAIDNHGEGIFFSFNDDLLDKWEKDANIIKRTSQIFSNYSYFRLFDNMNASFVMMHTFAHILINQLSYDSGYGSSSIRERIYFSRNPEHKMNGLLIYTTGDSEGSLGGLVSLGKPELLDNIVNNALSNSTWCSSDPICSETIEQGPEGCNKAACHNCALIAETCCENGNRLLDRNLLIHKDYGLFKKVLNL